MLKKEQVEANLISNLLENNKDFIDVLERIIKEYKTKEKTTKIPLEILSNNKLGILEATIKYLKENSELTYTEIAKILKRDDRTVWTSYKKAVKKQKEPFLITDYSETFNPEIISNRKQSPLEAIILHLQSKGFNLKQIALKLNRSYKNIWLTERRVRK